MLALQYSHRLPSDCNMSSIRDRAARRGPLWDDVAGLVFKAFVALERGRHQGEAYVYASVYLWQDTMAAARFLAGDRFRSVVDSFGRLAVEIGLLLDLQVGTPRAANWLQREEQMLEDARDGDVLLDVERGHHRALAARGVVVVTWSALDARVWRLVRFLLCAEQPPRKRGASPHEVLSLAAPGLRGNAQ